MVKVGTEVDSLIDEPFKGKSASNRRFEQLVQTVEPPSPGAFLSYKSSTSTFREPKMKFYLQVVGIAPSNLGSPV
jgi:hypothetical protein